MAEFDTNLTNLVLSGNLTVAGTSTLTGTLALTGALTVGTTLGVTGLSTLTGGATIDGGNLTMSGVNINLDPTGTYACDMDATKTHTTTLADNLASALVIADGTAQYLDIDTVTGTEKIDIGNAGDNPVFNVLGAGQITLTGNVDCSAGVDISGGALTVASQAITQTTSGQVTFAGNVDADGGVDVTTAALTTAAGFTVSGGAVGVICTNIDLDPTGTFDLAMDNGQAFSVDIDGAASNLTLATDGAAQDLTVAVTGATNSSLVLASAGTGADALQVTSSAGGVDISAALGLDLVSGAATAGWTHTAAGGAQDLTIAVAGAVDSSLFLTSTGTGVDALQLTASAGGMVLSSNAPLTMELNSTGALQYDNAAISGFAGATDTVGLPVYVETQDAGATPTAARVGGHYTLKGGDGASAANAVACGAGANLSFSSGRGGVNTGGASGQAGGAGGSITFLCEEGGDTDSTGAHNAGAGADFNITSGAGGNATAGTGDGGDGGDIILTPNTGGTTTGGSSGDDGLIVLAGPAEHVMAGDASGVVIHAIGPATDEGKQTVLVDFTSGTLSAVETAVFTVPTGSIITYVGGNCETAIGFPGAAGTSVTWSIGTAADPDKYGTAGMFPTQADSLAQNSKSNWIPIPAQLTGAEAIVFTIAATGGNADGDTAPDSGVARVVIMYDTYLALANA